MHESRWLGIRPAGTAMVVVALVVSAILQPALAATGEDLDRTVPSRDASKAPMIQLAQQQPPRTQPAPQQRAPATKGARPDTAASGDGGLRQRVETLEEQLIDMQVVIGTLESLARSGGGGGGGAGSAFRQSGASEAARIDALETQIRAMTMQIEQLSAQVRQLSGGRMEAPPVLAPPPPGGRSEAPGFGQVTVSPGGRDPIGQIISSDRAAPERRELPPPAANAANAKELYETAYGYLLQQDYGAAEAAFEEFLKRFPTDRLASDAQYWLGETLFVQRRYKPAGQAFLKVIQNHRTSAKAPNSLLMLAMTLEQLGQKDCALFTELDTRHPNAAADIKSRARIVRQRVGC